ERRVDLRDQLALTVAGTKFDRAVGFRGRPVREVGVVDVLFLQRLQRDFRLAEDLVLPGQELGAEIVALPLVHERLFFSRPVVLQLFQRQPCPCQAEGTGPLRAAPYIATSCDRQYLQPGNAAYPQGLAQANLSALPRGHPGASIADRETLA